MKLTAVAVLATYVALIRVGAAPTPIRLLVSSLEEDSPLRDIRFGHAVQPMPPYRKDADRELLDLSPPPPGFPIPPTNTPDLLPLNGKEGHIPSGGRPPKRFRHRPDCHRKKGKFPIFIHRIKIKAIKIGNCFRKALGWPLIELKHHRYHHHHHHHGHPHPPPNDGKKDEEAGRIRIDGGLVTILPFSESEHHHQKYHDAFLSRLHHSLMNLGRWEGRAVAFVIGCGIGVLIRMFWVLAIVSYRACRGYRDDGYATLAIMEEYDSDDETVIPAPSPKVEPPKYVYPVDEKIATEESN